MTSELRKVLDAARIGEGEERPLAEHEESRVGEAARECARLLKLGSRATAEEEADALDALVDQLREHYGRSVKSSGTAAKWVAATFGRVLQSACKWQWVVRGEPALASPDRRWVIYVGLVAHDVIAVKKRRPAFRAMLDTVRRGKLPAAEPGAWLDVMPVPEDSPVRKHAAESRL